MFLKPGVQVFMWHLLRSTYIIDCTRRNLAQKSAIVLRDKFLLFVISEIRSFLTRTGIPDDTNSS